MDGEKNGNGDKGGGGNGKSDPADEDALIEDDWNTMRIRVVGGHVTTWLNGRQMVDLEDEIAEMVQLI